MKLGTIRLLTGFTAAFLLFISCTSTKKTTEDPQENLNTILDKVLSESVDQYKYLGTIRPSDQFPRTFEKGELKTTRSDGWVSGFYPGTLLLLNHYQQNDSLKVEAERTMKLLEKEQYNKRTHDLGFMMYCSFGTARQVLPGGDYDTILINSAKSLSTRFNPKVGCIKSWDSGPSKFLVIIDNMMNLELLMYAFRQTGDSSFYKISVEHANTTMKNHFREDFSSYHVVDYNPENGTVNKKHTHQGAADSSAWARGQAWGLYGYTMMYRETGDTKYLDQANHIADFILQHPNLPKDLIPYWDFDAPGIPNAYRDVSAAAVISSALLELEHYVSKDLSLKYQSAAEKILKNLSEEPYRAKGKELGGFLLNHSVGHFPNKSEIDVPLSYADYYYVEAMLRYLGKIPSSGQPGKGLKWNNGVQSATEKTADAVINKYKTFLYNYVSVKTVEKVPEINNEGRWNDISYSSNQPGVWQLSEHMQRIKRMSMKYADSNATEFKSPRVKLSIESALDDWFQHRYQSKNWWHNEIGIPQIMRDIIVLMKDDLDSARLKKSLEILNQHKVKGTGANLVWSADLGLHYGALTSNYSMMKYCRDTILTVMKITEEEGVQPDFSFHQHGKRLQMYHYGGAFLLENVRLAWQLSNTLLEFPDEKINVLTGFVLNGWQWMARGIHTVPGTIDRAASRKNSLHSADIRQIIPLLYEIHPGSKDAFKKMLEIQQGKSSLIGYRYYPYSDFTSYHTKDFSFLLKTYSNRTLLTESINEENLKGELLNSGDGYFIHDGSEYFNLAPFWDWTKLPGITNFVSSRKAKPIANLFVGNVGDSLTGMAVMDYGLQLKDTILKVKKIWINYGNTMISLIAGLPESDRLKTFTVMDQSRWQSDVTVNRSGNVLKEGEHKLKQTKWIHHSNFLYSPLYNEPVIVSNQIKNASWSEINRSESAALINDGVFMPYILHKGGSSGYMVSFNKDVKSAASFHKNFHGSILRNNINVQSFRISDDLVFVAVYQKGKYKLDKDLQVEVSKPCLIMLKDNILHVSDPSHTGGSFRISVNGKKFTKELPSSGSSLIIR
jgi:chondroitin AC lyase